MKRIYANCLVRDEEGYVEYGIRSVLDYVDKVLVCDTGSIDETVKIIESIDSPKIELTKIPRDYNLSLGLSLDQALTHYRQFQLYKTLYDGADWMMILDGDEVWHENAMDLYVNKIIETGEYDIIAAGLWVLNAPGQVCEVNTFRAHWAYDETPNGIKFARFFNLNAIKGIHWQHPWGREQLQNEDGQPVCAAHKMYICNKYRIFHFQYDRTSVESEYLLGREGTSRQQGHVRGTPVSLDYPSVMRSANERI